MDESVVHAIQQLGPPSIPRPAPPPPGGKPQRSPEASPSTAGETDVSTGSVDKTRVRQAVDTANRIADFLDKKVTFSYDDRIDQVIVKIVRKSTEEVIRQVPPEEMVELMARLRQDFRGLIFNHTG